MTNVLVFFFFFFFFFFSWRYNPWWALAWISFHNLLSLHFSLQFLTFIFFKSSSTCSSHLSLGLPTGLDEHVSHSVSFLTVLTMSTLITCAAYRNLCDFINLTIVSFLIRISNSSFVLILHVPSLSFVGLYIFLSTLLSNISRRFYSVTVIGVGRAKWLISPSSIQSEANNFSLFVIQLP